MLLIMTPTPTPSLVCSQATISRKTGSLPRVQELQGSMQEKSKIRSRPNAFLLETKILMCFSPIAQTKTIKNATEEGGTVHTLVFNRFIPSFFPVPPFLFLHTFSFPLSKGEREIQIGQQAVLLQGLTQYVQRY